MKKTCYSSSTANTCSPSNLMWCQPNAGTCNTDAVMHYVLGNLDTSCVIKFEYYTVCQCIAVSVRDAALDVIPLQCQQIFNKIITVLRLRVFIVHPKRKREKSSISSSKAKVKALAQNISYLVLLNCVRQIFKYTELTSESPLICTHPKEFFAADFLKSDSLRYWEPWLRQFQKQLCRSEHFHHCIAVPLIKNR